MDSSILNTTKKILGIDEIDYAFDTDIITHINSVLGTISQLGVGPSDGFIITGPNEVWGDLIGTQKKFEMVKSYIYLKVRLMFDPPSSSFVLEAMNREATQLEWRLTVNAEPPVIPII